ncbi:dihydropteroate synthase [Thermaerobacter marianensis]|uniref:dihydropteroate synthase n=1 Tax=Thermaerobacter marianensis TaxID=73919 RepID=UPI001FA8190B|nr:dihydropteroate synthase [Thermaerobacter marianensis]
MEQWRRALERARRGQLAVLRQPWHRPVPGGTVAPYLVKVLCADEGRLAAWGTRYGLPARGICHHGRIPHYDLWGPLAEQAWAELAPATLGDGAGASRPGAADGQETGRVAPSARSRLSGPPRPSPAPAPGPVTQPGQGGTRAMPLVPEPDAVVAVHRGPWHAGPIAARLVRAGWPGATALDDLWRHTFEIAPLRPEVARRLAHQAAARTGFATWRPYAGAASLLVAGSVTELGELAGRWLRQEPERPAGRALARALQSLPFTAAAMSRGDGPAALGVAGPVPLARQPLRVDFRGRSLVFGERTLIMGVLNVTPDSFSDGGRYNAPDRAVRRALEMVAEGADLIDVGAESANIAASKPELEEELARLMPVVERLVREVDVPISIDTYKAPVAEAALQAGAHIINDISGLHADPGLAAVCARYGAGVVVMHLQGHPRSLAREPRYDDVVLDIARYLQEGVARALAAGVRPEAIVVDPGIGVGKRTRHNLEILENLGAFRSLGYPVLLGASRTSVIGNVLETPIGDRLEGTLATTALAVVHGADMVRVHDVRANARVARMADALVRGWDEPADGWPFDAVTGHQRRPLRELGRLPAAEGEREPRTPGAGSSAARS